MKSCGRQTQECVIWVFNFTQITECRVRARRPNKHITKTKGWTQNKRDRGVPQINTQINTHGTRAIIICAIHKGTKDQNTQHRYSHALTDIVTITDRGNRGHIYNLLFKGKGNRVCVIRQDSPGLMIMNPVQWSLESWWCRSPELVNRMSISTGVDPWR